MPDATNLYLFIVAALLLLIVPGPNMAIVTSHAVAHGWRAGLAAAPDAAHRARSDALGGAGKSAGCGRFRTRLLMRLC